METSPHDIYLHDAGHLVVAFGPLVVQVRSGEMNRKVHEVIVNAGALVRARLRRVAFLAIIEPEAPMLDEAVRALQRESLERFSRERAAPIAVVSLPGGLQASVERTLSRGLARDGAQILITTSLDEACAWLAEAMGDPDTATLRAHADEARRLLRETPA